MIKTVEEGLDRYKRALHRYYGRVRKLEKKHGEDTPTIEYPDSDYEYVMESCRLFKAMANVLGLSVQEDRKICEPIRQKMGLAKKPGSKP